MMEVTLHPTPRRRDVVLEQIRIVGLSLRPEALVVALVLGVGTFSIVKEIVGGGPGFDSNETFPTALIAFLFPFAVWRGHRRFGSAFLWTLPVDRQQLALARVFAGWVWLMAALAFFVSWLLALALVADAPLAQMLMRVPFTATTAMYLLGSALVLGLRHPLRWLLGTAGVIYLITGSDVLRLLSSIGLVPAADAAALQESAAVLWLGAGLVALWLAASRHRERRRQ